MLYGTLIWVHHSEGPLFQHVDKNLFQTMMKPYLLNANLNFNIDPNPIPNLIPNYGGVLKWHTFGMVGRHIES